MKIFRFHKSFNSVLIALAESGSFIPPEIATAMTQQAIDYRSINRHLIPLCQCTQLRDTGLVATNVSPLVVDLTRPLPESSSDSSINGFYYQRTPDEQAVYQDPEYQLPLRDHQLRRETFYLPFFQKVNTELDRLTKEFGQATLLMVSCNSQLQGREVSISGDVANHNFSRAIQAAEETKIEFQVGPTADPPLIDPLTQSERVTTCALKTSPESLLEGNEWSEEKADQLRDVLAALVSVFSAEARG